LLKKLVAQVEGATGAIVLEADGEAVQWYTIDDSDRLRLRSAYVGVVLKSSRAPASRAALGNLRSLLLQYDSSCLVVREIESDCFVVLELGPSANLGEALFRLDPIIRELRGEIAA
jgi:predicted regulator of Ras-like GTPase activity (Roadblock/LC7/MglB family)